MSDRQRKLQELERIRLERNLSEEEFLFLKNSFLSDVDEVDDSSQDGVMLGSYRLTERLGEGVLGKVYRAVSLANEEVALKVLRPELMQEPYLQRFQQCAEILMMHDHPNIVEVSQFMDSPALALVMESLDGAPFSVNDEPVPITAVEYIAQEMLKGASYWHEQGLIHGDLKPSNVILCSDGRVKILDYGMSKVLNDDDALAQGLWRGSLSHMAPECFVSAPTAAADIYAIGLIIWELLAGYPACPHNSQAAQQRWHERQGAVNIAEVRDDCAEWLGQVVMQMVSADPDVRPRNAEEALKLFLRDSSQSLRDLMEDEELAETVKQQADDEQSAVPSRPRKVRRRAQSVVPKTPKIPTTQVFQQLSNGFQVRLQNHYLEDCQVEFLFVKNTFLMDALSGQSFRGSLVYSYFMVAGKPVGFVVIPHSLLSMIFSLSVLQNPEIEEISKRVNKLSRTIRMIVLRFLRGFINDLKDIFNQQIEFSAPKLALPETQGKLSIGVISVGPTNQPYGSIAIGLRDELWQKENANAGKSSLAAQPENVPAAYMKELIMDIPVRLSAYIGRFYIPFEELGHLQLNSFIPLPDDWNSQIHMAVNGQARFHGEYGEHEGLRAIRIKKKKP